MKMDVRTSVALGLLATSVNALAQNAPQDQTPPTQQAPPPAAQAQPPVQPATPAPPATPPLPRLPSQQYSPPPQQYRYQYSPAPAPQNASPPATEPRSAVPPPPQWVHSQSTYANGESHPDGFLYHPFRFHIDGGATITQQSNDTLLDNGWNAGLGLSWFPTSHLPLGIRIDGTYNEFDARRPLLNQAAATYGTNVDNGTEKLYGGDTDLELDLHLSPYVRAYLLAGGGWYREQLTFRQRGFFGGCDFFCGPGGFGNGSIVARNTTDWHFAENAGFGLEFAASPWTSFFIEARYMRLNPKDAKSDFLPIRAGLRF